MAAAYELTLADYLLILKRRAFLLAATFAGILGIALTVAVVIPPVYESTGTILVESQQIPTDLVAATITSYADERIEIIRQRVMTRENLLRIIDKYGLFLDDSHSYTVSEKIDEMRKAMQLSLVNANVKGRGQAAIAFRISYEHRRPEIANKVANELVTLFLDENIKQRTERATETTEFLTQEAEKLRVELETLENKLAEYKQKYADALPQHQELRMNMMSRTETEIREAERDFKSAQEEMRFLELELATAKSVAASMPKLAANSSDKPAPTLDSLKAELARLQGSYTDAHPDVRAVKRKIEVMEAPSSEGGAAEKAAAASIEVSRIQTKIAATEARIESFGGQVKTLRGKLAAYERQIVQAPQTERGLITLMRDHENAQKKYEEIRAKQMSARISENLEQGNKAERFILLEPPLMPDKPIKPNRKKMIALGFALALAGSGGLVMLLENLNQRVRGAEALAAILRNRVLVTIPVIPTQAELSRKRKWLFAGIAAIIAALIGVLAAVHFFYMPLEILAMKILARFE